jgi:hypothetical protein
MDNQDKENLRALHKLWSDLHEEQAIVLHELMSYASSNSASAWRRYDSVIERKTKVMEEIRALHHKGEE